MITNAFGVTYEAGAGPDGISVFGGATATTTGRWYKFVPMGNCVFSAATGAVGVNQLSGKTISTEIHTLFTSIWLVSGTGIAYNIPT